MPTDEERLLVRMEATLTKFERQLKRAQQVTNTTATGIENRFKRANTQIAQGADRAATGVMRITQISGAGRFVLQNTANQLGDIAVQMQTGAGASRVLGQQLPQLLGGFGALGGSLGVLAPLLGTVAAIGIPVAAALFAMSRDSEAAAEEAQTLADKVEALAQASKDYKSAAEESKTTIAELREKYGDLADEIQRALDVQRELASEGARAALSRAVASPAENFGGLGSAESIREQARALEDTLRQLDELERELGQASAERVGALMDQQLGAEEDLRRLQSFRRELEAVARQYNITREQAAQLAVAAAEAAEATGVEAQAEAAQRLADLLIEVFGSAQAANEATGGMVTQLTNAVREAGNVKATTDALPGSIGASADEAARLAGNLRDAASALLAAKVQVGLVPDVATGGGLPGAPTVPRVPLPPVNRPPARSSGGGGGGRTINAQEAADLAKVRRLYDETRTSAEMYAMEVEELNRLKEAGLVDNDLYARSMDQLNDKFGEAASRANSMESSFRSAFVSIITGAEDARSAVSKLLASLASNFANRAFTAIWSGSGLADAFSFDGGGYTGMGPRSGGIDGKGGFPAILHPNETVIDHTKGQGMGGGVTISIDARGAQVGVAEQIEAALDRRMPSIVTAASAVRANRLSRGKSA